MCQTIASTQVERSHGEFFTAGGGGRPGFPISSVPPANRIDTDVYLINAEAGEK